jgi:cell division protein FtsZ
VSYEEVIDKKSNQSEFIINEVKRETPVADTPKEEEQITLTFDLPLTPKKDSTPKEPETDDKVMFTLDEDYKDLDVNSYIEIVPVTEANETGEKRYVLEDLHEEETETKVQKKPSVVEEPVFEKKVLKAEDEIAETEQEIDPLTSPISELLKERANERRRKMKDFNYKFSNAKIDEIEREPAYKRQGVKFDESAHSSETITSRLSVGTDDNDDIQLRSNNSFLHDNVD